MVARAFDHCRGARIPNAETLARDSPKIRFAGDRAVHHRVADDDVRFRRCGAFGIGIDDDPPTRQPFADVVIGVAFELERDAVGEERAERLARRSLEAHANRIGRQSGMSVARDDCIRQHRADRAVGIADPVFELHRRLRGERRLAVAHQRMIERLRQAMLLFLAVVARDFRGHLRLVKHATEIEPARLPMRDALARVEKIAAPDQLVEATNAQLRHQLAHFLGDEEEKVDDVLGLSAEPLAQLRVLRRDADRARVQMTLAHHDAAGDDQRRRREAELVGAEHRADDDVAAGLHLAVDLDGDSSAQTVEHQRLLRFRQTQFPRRSRVLDR